MTRGRVSGSRSLPTRLAGTSLNRRRLVGGSAAAAMALGLPGSSLLTVRASSLQDGEPTIMIATLGDAATINPFQNNESEGDWRVKMLFDEVVRANPATYALEPGLASEWAIDDLTITFTIRDNATFSDGTDLTAEDVAFTLKGFLAGTTASPKQAKFLSIDGAAAYAAGDADDVSGIVVVDPKTLQVTLATPDAAFLYNMRFAAVVPAAALEGKSLVDDPWFQAPIGAGPYQFVSWTSGADFVASRNPNYWQEGKPQIAGFTHRTIADSQSIVLALQTGEVDGSNYPNPAAMAELEQNEDLVILVPPFSSPNGWMFNLANEHLAKQEVRLAIAMATDTVAFANDSLLGLGGPGLGPIAPDSWAFDPDLEPIPYDPETARQLVIDAGSEGAQIRFCVNQGNVLREDWLIFTQQAMQEIGIEVIPEVIDYPTLVTRVIELGDYDATGVDFAGVTAEPSQLYEQFYTGSTGNYMNYSNPDLDVLLTQARETLDQDEAKPIYAEIQRIIMTDVPMHYAWYRPFLHAIDKRFEGYTDSAAYGLFHTLEDWTVVE